MKEIWKPIKDYEDLYEVSNLGRVKRLTTFRPLTKYDGLKTLRIYHEKILSTKNNSKKNLYHAVGLHKDGHRKTKSIHRLVAQAFLGLNDAQSFEVGHKDNCPWNNNVTNLYLCTKIENEQHKVMCGRTTTGEKCGGSKLKQQQVLAIINMKKSGTSSKILAKVFSVSTTQINRIFNGTSRQHIVGRRNVRVKQ